LPVEEKLKPDYIESTAEEKFDSWTDTANRVKWWTFASSVVLFCVDAPARFFSNDARAQLVELAKVAVGVWLSRCDLHSFVRRVSLNNERMESILWPQKPNPSKSHLL
jgi:hypothetical protein